MEILDEKDGVDTELLVYAMTLINKVCVSAGSTCVGVFIFYFYCLTCAKRKNLSSVPRVNTHRAALFDLQTCCLFA